MQKSSLLATIHIVEWGSFARQCRGRLLSVGRNWLSLVQVLLWSSLVLSASSVLSARLLLGIIEIGFDQRGLSGRWIALAFLSHRGPQFDDRAVDSERPEASVMKSLGLPLHRVDPGFQDLQ